MRIPSLVLFLQPPVSMLIAVGCQAHLAGLLIGMSAEGGTQLSMNFEMLNLALMLLRIYPCRKRSQITALPGRCVLLRRVQTKFTRFQSANHPESQPALLSRVHPSPCRDNLLLSV